ncbi:MAG: SDR family oxidoreductase [Acidobacteriota bacterium]
MLLTGASGYVGGRLLEALEARGLRIRCLARTPRYLEPRIGPGTEVVRADLLDPSTLPAALQGVRTAYYLVHSMASPGAFREQDRQAANHFAAAAREVGLERIVYLGGLGRGDDLSPHLASRQEVGRILRESGVPTVELRASIIIGSGSLSFEMIRNLVEKLPLMVAPRWVRLTAQPIAIEDVVEYLLLAREIAVSGSLVVEIGGTDRVSYLDLLREYAAQRGLRRWILPVPVLTPRLSSLWLGLVTPVYARVGRSLIDSLRHETVVTDDTAARRFPIRPRGSRESIRRALRNEDRDFAHTRWSDALSSGGTVSHWGGRRFGARIVDSRSVRVACSPAQAFAPIRRIGGETGWYFGNALWRLRGFLDLLVGGVGMRRGRRSPEALQPGDTVDFWRVEEVREDRLLRLQAEMKLPGRAWLQFEVDPAPEGAVVRQTAIFDPLGLSGLAYWYVLYPVHHVIFTRMVRNIARAGEREAKGLRGGARTAAPRRS